MANEADSNTAIQTLLWAFGAAIQDENEHVVLNSPETVAAVEYMKTLYEKAMTPEVFGWGTASNNQLLLAGKASYILNSISAYRTAQEAQPDVAEDIFFSTPLVGPAGSDWALSLAQVVFIYMVPEYTRVPDTAKEFLLHLVNNYAEVAMQSELYNFPAWPGTVPELNEWLSNDPFGSRPVDKLAPLGNSEEWTVNPGWPGPARPMLQLVRLLPPSCCRT